MLKRNATNGLLPGLGAYAKKAISVLTHSLPKWTRAQQSYPSLHYRYSHDIANVLELKAVGFYARSGAVRWRWERAASVAIIAMCPVAAAAILAIVNLSRPPEHLAVAYFGWLSYFLFLTIFEVLIAWIGVTIFHNLTNELQQLLTQKGRDTYDRWANYATATLPQLIFALLFSVGACCALWIAATVHGMNSRIYIATPSYLSVGVCSFFISQATYWIIAGTILSVLLTRSDHMNPIWHSPAYSPGIELLARCYRLAFYGASIGVALCLFPLLTWVYKGPNSSLLLAVKVVLFAGSATAAALIAVIPQWRISMVVAQRRRETIRELQALVPANIDAVRDGSRIDPDLLDLFQLACSSPSSTVQSSTIAGILLGLAAAMLPYIVRLVG